MLKEENYVTAVGLKSKLLGTDIEQRMLIPIFQEHNDKVEALVGQDFAPGTLERYKTSLKHTQEFLIWKYKTSAIDITKIDHAFIMDYDFWLRSVRQCANNTAVKYIKNFKKIIRLCMANGWLAKDPFLDYKAKLKVVERPYLTKEEIQMMYEKEFVSDRLNQVRDIFLFSCYTGLAYVDVKQLSKSNINIGIDGDQWIFTHRQKTDTSTRIPLLPLAQELILIYENHPQCVNTDVLFPVLSNQKMNSYLKEIANVCGIDKDLTFHIARHTFATTVTLSNGVPIESVSKMLGHTNIKTTQHYAKILDKKVSDDMLALRRKLKNQKSN
jgi:site-specific recombinase XerD